MVWVIVVLLLLSGCGASTPHRTIALAFEDHAPRSLGHDPDEVRTAQVVAQLIRDRFDMPFPEGTMIRVYVNQATFAEGLAQDGGHVSDDAWDRSRVAAAVASRRGLFVRGDIVNGMRLADKVGLFAHELAHVSQLEMRRGGRGAPAHWIREGHADWVKYQTLELLRMRTYAESRDEVKRAILRSRTAIRFFPPLSELARGDRWTDAGIRLGSAATYGQSFLAVDWLVERYGIERLNEFNRRFSRNEDPRSHWSHVFPIRYSDFLTEFRARLEQLGA